MRGLWFSPTQLTLLSLYVSLGFRFIQHINAKHCLTHQVSLQWISYQNHLFYRISLFPDICLFKIAGKCLAGLVQN